MGLQGRTKEETTLWLNRLTADDKDWRRIEAWFRRGPNKPSLSPQGIMVSPTSTGQRYMTLAAALCPHKDNQVVRPINGDWWDVRRENLKAVTVRKGLL